MLKNKRARGMCLLAGVCLALAVAAFASAETGQGGEGNGKNLCLLYGENCPDRRDSITDTIARLKQEIARGEAVYTRKELERLQQKLDYYEWLLYMLLYSPS